MTTTSTMDDQLGNATFPTLWPYISPKNRLVELAKIPPEDPVWHDWVRARALVPTTHTLRCQDNRYYAPGQVELVVTSPPYWNLKDYQPGAFADEQLGDVQDYERFLHEVTTVFSRCLSALVPGGRLCVVVGDVCQSRKACGRHQVISLHSDISVRCRELGFDCLAPIYWHKISNCRREVEGRGCLGRPFEPMGIVKLDVEIILLFRKPGAYRRPSKLQQLLSVIPQHYYHEWFRQWWTIPGNAKPHTQHPATYAPEVPERLINMFSFVGDTVYDPFAGTGTTNLAAMYSGRSSIGCDCVPEYVEEARLRLLKERAHNSLCQSAKIDGWAAKKS